MTAVPTEMVLKTMTVQRAAQVGKAKRKACEKASRTRKTVDNKR